MTHPLLTQRFLPLFAVQFLSAFADNLLKNGLAFVILASFAGSQSEALVSAAGAVFMLPFFLLSALGGDLADSMDKARVARRLKEIELAVCLVAAAGFAFSSTPVLFLALLGFGIVSALFGPVKYGIIPDHLPKAVPLANAAIEGSTFLAILAGTALGAIAGDGSTAGRYVLAVSVTVLSLASVLASRFIPPTAVADPGRRVDPNILRSTFRSIGELWSETKIWRCAVATSVFWLVGAVMMSIFAPLVVHVLHGTNVVATVHLALFATALGAGSFAAAWIAGGRVVLLPATMGAVVAALAALDAGLRLHGLVAPLTGPALGVVAYFSQAPALRVAVDLAIIAFGGGLIVIPTFAAVQIWALPARRAQAIAAVSIMNAAVMVVGALGVGVAQTQGADVGMVLIATAFALGISALWMAFYLPSSPFRDSVGIILRIVYRIEVRGAHNLDQAQCGPNPVIAINHLSFLDAVIALSILPCEPVFAIDATIAKRWWLKPFVRTLRATPLDPTSPLATRTLIASVKAGDPLVIFPEGRLTMTGALMKVYDGAALVADKAGVAIVPVKLEGPEATVFSRLDRRQVRKRWFPKIVVSVLEPVRLEVDPALKGRARRHAAGAALYGIMSDAAFRTSLTEGTVLKAVISAARKHGWSRVAVEDPIAGPLSYRRLLAGARALAPHVARLPSFELDGDLGSAVGVMLPSSCTAAVTFLACQSAGRIPAMINFTAGGAAITSACAVSRIATILTSRAFVKKAKLEPLIETLSGTVGIVYLEDVKAEIGLFDRLAALARCTAPHARQRENGSPAAILFTSGSEGTPKGVVLTHRNMLSNAAQAAARIDFGRADRVFSVLPTFHSFGLTAALILPLVSGVPVYLYPSPLHYRMIPELVYTTNATILFGTDTFLTGYARNANAYDFRSLRYVVAGAEPVRASTRMTWLEKLGLRVLEGYGVTETAPVLALNTPMFNKFGTVGRIMPGMEWRLEPVAGIEEGGQLIVRGPNLMAGYLLDSSPGRLQAPKGGWYDTGDIVTIDAQGFVTIKGRAKRFAKVAGEMVSLAAVEAVANDLWPDASSACVATPDDRKGERLVLLTTKVGATRAEFSAFAKGRGLIEIGHPASIITVDALPLLGSGKADYKALPGLLPPAVANAGTSPREPMPLNVAGPRSGEPGLLIGAAH